MLQKHPGVFWIDSSIRFRSYNDGVFRQVVETDGALFMIRGINPTITVTHGKMFEYISSNMTALRSRRQGQAGCVLFYRTKHTYENIIMWMAFCALDKQCIAPTDKLKCSSGHKFGVFSKECHRYDQSLMNILMANSYEFDHAITTSKVRIAVIHRWTEQTIADRVQICLQSNKSIS